MTAGSPDPADVKVSVCMITYNHEAFIAQAVESVLMQQTDFAVELVIGEDCSTDGTRAIVCDFGERYPARIRLRLPERNQGMQANGLATLKECRGQYIALLDGDDYWTDPNKLQKQVDFLEGHPEYPFCFHPVFLREENTGQERKHYYSALGCGALGIRDYYTLDDLLEYSNFIPTDSVVFRNRVFEELPDWFYQAPFGDFPLHILNICSSGLEHFGFIDEHMAVYRLHSGGVYSGNSRTAN
jgi:glycosyltransferase involved in cell wall biosynthesis